MKDVNWLLSNAPAKLEEQDVSAWIKSEKAKWEYIYEQKWPEREDGSGEDEGQGDVD